MLSLAEIVLGDEALQGDDDVSRRNSSVEPFNYINCLVMRGACGARL